MFPLTRTLAAWEKNSIPCRNRIHS